MAEVTRKLLLVEVDNVTTGFLNAYVSLERIHELPTAEELGRVAWHALNSNENQSTFGTPFIDKIGQAILDTLTKRTTNWRGNEQTIPFSR